MQATHEVFNQALPRTGHNLFDDNAPLRDALAFNAPALDPTELRRLGAALATDDMQANARLANVHLPQLRTHDRFGRREDRVEFHPSYHALMALAVESGLHGTHGPARRTTMCAAPPGFMLFTELGAVGAVPDLDDVRRDAGAARQSGPRRAVGPAAHEPALYDGRFVPAHGKPGITMGMGMTEKQGGSDVRATRRRRCPPARTRGPALRAHRPQVVHVGADVRRLPRPRAVGGGPVVLLPAAHPARRQRQRDAHPASGRTSSATTANASSEVEFDGALAWLVGDEGRGVPQILEMGNMTRLDCALGTAGLMRQALSLALHHTAQRSAFGRRPPSTPR